jgi:alkylation response protein AidB-like acyl-CoA dehydrogenase
MFFTDDQKLMQDVAREFAQKEVAPRALEIDQGDEMPMDLLKRAAELNLISIAIPEEYGGVGADLVTACLVVEEIAKESPAVAILIDLQAAAIATALLQFGTEEQKQKYVTGIAKGDMWIAFGLTEPNAGSDAGNTQTTAELDGDEWVINGQKCFITGITGSTGYIITAKTNVDGKQGISAFIVEKGDPGFSVGKVENKTGWGGSATGDLFFKDCRIPKDRQVGVLNKGFNVFMRTLDEARVGIAALALGNAEGAYERALAYSKERVAFGQPICKFQAIAFYLAEMATDIEVGRAMLYNTAALADSGAPFSKEAAMCKLWLGEMAQRVTDRAIQIHGGNGYIRDVGVERFWRDARVLTIGEGTSEIQKTIISRAILS